MSKILKKAGILTTVFAVAVILYFVLSRESGSQADVTYTAMADGTFPIIYTGMYGRDMNLMYGYRQDMGNESARDSLTILPPDRNMSIRIADYDGTITGIGYEVRSLDLQRLVEDTKVETWENGENGTTAVLPIQNLLTKDKEYMLRVDVQTEAHGTIYYYTRILWTDNTNIQGMVDLAVDFSTKTFDYEQARSLVTYLETNDTEDNSTFGRTSIRSSFSQLTWGKLKMKPLGEVQVTLKELNGLLGVVQLRFLATRQNDEGVEEFYEVQENFTMKWNELRTYLMDYEREVHQIFQGEKGNHLGKRIMLGITGDERVGVKKSTDGNTLAFISNRDLWSYNQSERHFVKVFSFREGTMEDVRANHGQHNIQILKTSDNGDIDFLVYGYMNRGNREGQMGVVCYRYDGDQNTIEERFFIPSSTSYERLAQDLNQLVSMANTNMLYLYVDHAIYGIDLESNEYLVVADALSEGNYAISTDKTRVAWLEGGKQYESEKLNLLDFNTGEKTEVYAEKDGVVRPLGFVGADLVYGLGKAGDIWIINGRVEGLPLYALEILNSDMVVETRYEKEGYYISDASVSESRIHVNLVNRLSAQNYVYAQEDTIVCNMELQAGALNGIGWYASQEKGKLYFVQLDQEIKSRSGIRVSIPKRVGSENSEVLELKSNYQTHGIEFYAFGGGKMLGVTFDFAKAVQMAYERMGIVVDQNQNIVWSRINRDTMRQIKDPATAVLPLHKHLEGFSTSRSFGDGLLALDARGCSMMQILYFIDQGIPVVAYTGENEYLLLCGYDQYNVTVYNPSTRETSKVGLNDSTEFFRARGNDFICAMQQE